MKSEQRHELKTNDLAKGLLTFQDYLKLYGGRAALVIAIVVCLVVLFVQRRNSAQREEAAQRDNLAYAREQVQHLETSAKIAVQLAANPQPGVSEGSAMPLKPSAVGSLRKTILDVREKATDKATQAGALVTQAELAWALANFPDVPAAATDKTLRPDKDPAALLAEAKEAYQQVISQYPDQTLDVVTAQMGLAAIAENAGEWDEAKKHYDTVKSMPNASGTDKQLADRKLKELEQLREPVLVGVVPDKGDKAEDAADADPFQLPDSLTRRAPATHPTTGATTAEAPKHPAAAPTTRPAGKATTRPSVAPR